MLFPQKNITNSSADRNDVIKKIRIDPSATLQKHLLCKRAESALTKNALLEAFDCAELLEDVEFAVAILRRAEQ